MAASRRLKELVSEALPLLEMPEDDCAVALSGGADSAALALLALEAGCRVSGVHVDHQLPASPRMAGAAAAIAGELGISLTVVQVNVGDGSSPEEQARDARYRALTALDMPVLTAHTRDDSVETMLINLVRGTGASGLAGIPRFRPPNIHRPMLEVTRSVTREVAAVAGLPFVDDPMNEDQSLTRNRIRLRILPLMRELNPQIDAAFARTAATLERDSGFLDGLAEGHGSGGSVPVSVLTTLPRVVADRVLRSFLEANLIEPSSSRIERMWSVACGDSKSQQLADDKTVLRRGAMLVIEPANGGDKRDSTSFHDRPT